MWYCYWGKEDPLFQKGIGYNLFAWISCQYWIDLLFDFATLALYIIGTYKVFNAVLKA
jgi:hypothetical protein